MAKVVGVKINRKLIQEKVSRSRRLNQKLEKAAKDKFIKNKQRLMSKFNMHPVTQEVEGGSSSSNISDSLSGYGNLFSFIGFPEGSAPVEDVRRLLENSVKIKIHRRNSINRNLIEKNYNISVPVTADFMGAARMPFEGGNNWIEMIEKGMSSFSHYMNKKTAASRSGSGIQIDGNIRSQSSRPTQYMTELLNKFKKELMLK